MLEPNAAQAIAVTLHELATNAAKYGSLSVSNGQIELNWSHQDDGRLNLRWTEMGGAPLCGHLRAEALADASLNK